MSPLLSWKQGTVNAGIPTAASPWCLVSFQSQQPPVLLTFDDDVQLELSGQAGDWTLRTRAAYSGWVRVSLPLGQKKIGADAHALGEAVQYVEKFIPYAETGSPELKGLTIKSDDISLTAIWTFDKPGAVVPPALILARYGGYPVQIRSGLTESSADLHEGPTVFAAQSKLIAVFPLTRIPAGRAFLVGGRAVELPQHVSGFDIPSIAELALSNMAASRRAETIQMIVGAQDEFLHSIKSVKEPWTAQNLPFNEGGQGLDLVAAHAFLLQSGLTGEGADSSHNFWLSSLLRRRDWSTCGLLAQDPVQARRASVLTALACALCPEPERRLSAVLLEAGIASDSVLKLYSARRKFPLPRGSSVNPLASVRRGIFREDPQPASSSFVESLTGEFRLLSSVPVAVEKTTDGYLLKWEQATKSQSTFSLSCGFPLEIEAGENLDRVVPTGQLGLLGLKFEAKAPGACSVLVKFPSWAPPIPKAVVSPRYSE